jgi:hypothetical protein
MTDWVDRALGRIFPASFEVWNAATPIRPLADPDRHDWDDQPIEYAV